MARLDMEGPFKLKDVVIDREVSADLIGNYALGFMNKKGKFVVKFIGRSDDSLRDGIKAAGKKYGGGLFSRLFGHDTLDKFNFPSPPTLRRDIGWNAGCSKPLVVRRNY